MLFRTSVVLAAFLAQSAFAIVNSCPPGKYLYRGNCYDCADGYYKMGTNNASSCSPCPAGKESNPGHTDCNACSDGFYSTGGEQCDACDAGKQSNPGHTACTTCPSNTASTGGTMCQTCPAGQQAATNHRSCNKCDQGYFNDTPGGQCRPCPGGTFNNVKGAKTCCSCCAGWYSASASASQSCTKCPTTGPPSSRRPYSAVGSDNNNDCQAAQGNLPTPATSCSMTADNVCPNPNGGGPVGSPIARKKRDTQCTKGFTSCPHYSGRGGFECVDTENDPESCGGCVGADGQGSGTDCTAIKGVSVTRCVSGSCVVDSCRKGWVKSIDGTSCVLVSRTAGSSSESTGLYAQDTGAKKKRSSAKRAIRANIY